jgi:hypothetical protein
MNAFNKLFTLKNTAENQQNTTAFDEIQTDDQQSYYHKGYLASGEAKGNSAIFKSCLEDLYEDFKQKCRRDEQEQQRLNAPYIAQKENLKSTLNARETLKTVKEETLDEINTNINNINNNIPSVKKYPEKFGLDVTKKPRAQFFIGLIILLPITLYLFVFYISASYSAFFKAFNSNEVIAAIFDANALSKAINDGLLEAIFVCTIPFAFLGLGFLIHMFQKEKRTGKLKILALFIVTFIFDSILAYQIERKIYDFDKTLTSPPFDLKIAFSSVEFWGIIFAGFVVYIIWGLIFDFTMKEYDNIDKIESNPKTLFFLTGGESDIFETR